MQVTVPTYHRVAVKAIHEAAHNVRVPARFKTRVANVNACRTGVSALYADCDGYSFNPVAEYVLNVNSGMGEASAHIHRRAGPARRVGNSTALNFLARCRFTLCGAMMRDEAGEVE